VHGVEPAEAQDCAKAWDGWEEGQGLGSVWLGCCEEKECKIVQQLRILGEKSEVDLHGLGHGDILTTLGHPGTVGCVGNLLADLGQVLLAVGMLPMRSQCRPVAHQVGAAAEQGAGGAHRSRRDRGGWKPAAAEPCRTLVGIDLGVLGLAAVPGFHVERMPQHAGDAVCGTAVGEPVPGAATRDGHDQAGTSGRHSLEKRCKRGLHVAVEQHCAIVTHDADVHTPGLHVETAVKGGLRGGESP
jgi:hypothetical protein